MIGPMRKKILPIVLPLLAVALEALPTGSVMYFGNPDGEPFRQTFSYFDPIHWGYADFAPNLTAFLTCALLVLAVVNAFVLGKKLTRAMTVLAVIAAICSLLTFVLGGTTLIGAGISVLLILTAVLSFINGKNI